MLEERKQEATPEGESPRSEGENAPPPPAARPQESPAAVPAPSLSYLGNLLGLAAQVAEVAGAELPDEYGHLEVARGQIQAEKAQSGAYPSEAELEEAAWQDPRTAWQMERLARWVEEVGAKAGEEIPAEYYRPVPVGLRLKGPRKGRGRKLVKKPQDQPPAEAHTAEQKLMILDTWRLSNLPATNFAPMVGVTPATLRKWKGQFDEYGPAGLEAKPKGGPRGSKLPEVTKRAILMMKESHPEWGCQRISDLLLRGPALPASASAVARLLHESGYELEEVATKPHPDKVRSFERAKPGSLWQTDIFTFILKRQNRRVYLTAFMDDHSRFIVSHGLYASASTKLVLEVLEAGIASYGPPEEILTDNGPQYVTWRGKSAFTKECEKRGIKQIVARPRRPQTLGKAERFWGTLWRECAEAAIFMDLEDARKRIGLFIDHYNFQRPHQGVGGLVPADRFFSAAPEVLQTLKARVQANALHLAQHGVPREQLYLAGQVGGKAVSLHAKGGKVILRREGEESKEVDLGESNAEAAEMVLAERRAARESEAEKLPEAVSGTGGKRKDGEGEIGEVPAPGVSVLDEGLARLNRLEGEKAQPGPA